MVKEFGLPKDVSLERLISSLGKKKTHIEIITEFGYLFINNLKIFYLKAFVKKKILNPVQLTFSL